MFDSVNPWQPFLVKTPESTRRTHLRKLFIFITENPTNLKSRLKMPESMELIPIKETLDENKDFVDNPLCKETIFMTIDFYKKVGYAPPWICYYVKKDNELVGSAGIKGKPLNGTIEIAYGTMEKHRNGGIGTAICKLLVDLALKADPAVRVTARTLPEENFSTRILRKNNFNLIGTVNDPEDGEVWEWLFKPGDQ